MTLIEQIKDLINRVENARNFDGSEGKWVTIKGTHVFIPDGKSVEEVIEEKGWGSEKGEKKDITKRREVEYKGAKIDINPDGKYADIKIYAPEGKTFANGDTFYTTQKLTEKAEEQAKEIIDGEFGNTPETPKEGKRTRREVSPEDVGIEKTLEGGIKETHDQYGRTTFTKGNKWANVSSNGGRSDSWIAAYGLTHQSAISWEREKGVTEEQLLNSRDFKTEKGARKWALEQLKRLTSDNSLEEAFTEALAEVILEQ